MKEDNLIIEQSIIGCLIISPEYINNVLSELKHSEYFTNKINKSIFNIILDKFSKGLKIDFVTILNELEVEGETKEKLKNYMLNMFEVAPTLSMLKEYVKIIKGNYKKRRVCEFCSQVLEGKLKKEPYDQILKEFESLSYSLLNDKRRSDIVILKDALLELLEDLDKKDVIGYGTGFNKLDDYISGLNKSDLILLAARPGVGKTSLALNIARNISKDHKVLFFSLEMSRKQLVQRLICMESDLSLSRFRASELNKWDWEKVLSGADDIQFLNLLIDDNSYTTVSDIRTKAMLCQGVEVIMIDYLQLISSDEKFFSRTIEVADMTRKLKILAKELDVPILCLSQLSRATEQRFDHRPMLSDLRDSGSIEQDADIVLLLYRQSMYKEEKNKDEDDEYCECIVAKNRHGETGTANLRFDSKFSKFSN